MKRNATQCNATQRNAMQCNAMQWRSWPRFFAMRCGGAYWFRAGAVGKWLVMLLAARREASAATTVTIHICSVVRRESKTDTKSKRRG